MQHSIENLNKKLDGSWKWSMMSDDYSKLDPTIFMPKNKMRAFIKFMNDSESI